MLDGAEGYYIELGLDGFGAGDLYIDVGQCKGAGDFAKEGRFFVVGLDQGQGQSGIPDFQGEAGESCACAYVCYRAAGIKIFHHRGHRGNTGEQAARGEEGFAEVAGYDFFWSADRGQVDAGVPTDQYIDVYRYMLQLRGGKGTNVVCDVWIGWIVLISNILIFSILVFILLDGRTQERVEEFGDASGVHREQTPDCRGEDGRLEKRIFWN